MSKGVTPVRSQQPWAQAARRGCSSPAGSGLAWQRKIQQLQQLGGPRHGNHRMHTSGAQHHRHSSWHDDIQMLIFIDTVNKIQISIATKSIVIKFPVEVLDAFLRILSKYGKEVHQASW
jgi:hypothetical protein